MTRYNLTHLETVLLNNIATSEYSPSNGSPPESFEDTGTVWSTGGFLDGDGLSAKALPGVMASLSKKGLVVCHTVPKSRGCDFNESTVRLTREGFDAWKQTRTLDDLERKALTKVQS